jgi:hypothetical protein
LYWRERIWKGKFWKMFAGRKVKVNPGTYYVTVTVFIRRIRSSKFLKQTISFLPSSAPVGHFTWNWAELVLLVFPSSDLTRPDPKKYQNNFYSKTCNTSLALKSKTTSIISPKGRRPNFLLCERSSFVFFLKSCNTSVAESKWKTTTTLFQMEDNLNL